MLEHDELGLFIVVINGDCCFNKSGTVFVDSDVLSPITKINQV